MLLLNYEWNKALDKLWAQSAFGGPNHTKQFLPNVFEDSDLKSIVTI